MLEANPPPLVDGRRLKIRLHDAGEDPAADLLAVCQQADDCLKPMSAI
jgi:hypothetical protein